jgi:hypothetical protein
MRDILKLLLGDGEGDGREAAQGAGGWDQPGRRASVADSREWCGSGPGEDAIRHVAAQLRGRARTGHRGVQRVVVRRGRRAGPFGVLETEKQRKVTLAVTRIGLSGRAG